jgi:G patch domain-containing protein 1
MSFKRSHATYEADLFSATVIAPQYVTFGTPLPPTDSLARDDGTYVPLHKQEVRDEKGRRRLHGAFTGGWSAGYVSIMKYLLRKMTLIDR